MRLTYKVDDKGLDRRQAWVLLAWRRSAWGCKEGGVVVCREDLAADDLGCLLGQVGNHFSADRQPNKVLKSTLVVGSHDEWRRHYVDVLCLDCWKWWMQLVLGSWRWKVGIEEQRQWKNSDQICNGQ